jgi:hypothetical protein
MLFNVLEHVAGFSLGFVIVAVIGGLVSNIDGRLEPLRNFHDAKSWVVCFLLGAGALGTFFWMKRFLGWG